MLTAAAIVLHYFAFGPRHRAVAKTPRSVKRFGLCAVLLHMAVVAAFLVLLATGAGAIATAAGLDGCALILHLAAAPVFAIAFTLKFIAWAEACRFASHDWTWAKRLGGYLGAKGDVPADRFNAGQKAFFWSTGMLVLLVILSGLGRLMPLFDVAGQAALYELHRSGALLLVLLSVVHLYVATLANPGTLTAMVLGKVSTDWAKYHHPLWWDRIKGDDVDEE